MKGAAFGIVVVCLAMAGFLAGTVSADLMLPTITHVYIEQNGTPFHESVNYTVTCFGYRTQLSPPPVTTLAPGSYQPESVYSYSATCPDYGCVIYEPYYTKHSHIDWCDLQVNTKDTKFIFRNFSHNPYSKCTDVPSPEKISRNRSMGLYYKTPEYLACWAHGQGYIQEKTGNWPTRHRVFQTCDSDSEPGCIKLFSEMKPVKEISSDEIPTPKSRWSGMNDQEFLSFLETCNPISDTSCGGWIIDGKPVKRIPGMRPFANTSSGKSWICDKFLINASPAIMVPEEIINGAWVDNDYLATEVCELRINLPPVNRTSNKSPTFIQTPTLSVKQEPLIKQGPIITTDPTIVPVKVQSPVESLYCSLLQRIGRMCE
ncbi:MULTISPECIES: hypothetical protein [unclassified Methanoregula]|uniref:hypothetical protein n=1 Tax=unclassified Methanoregula TaxID=2649730 RepID=UPI0009C63FB0|nr:MULTISPECIES: hypothetical protein [unclassified Methanoregula]OPX63348.1 MAG: hypothetical protein A4E33_01717 [Methanoregula sp. PtaB.Bin085]OPY35048.1 MAG: hypothetical protein A4E34_01070 [Methanoregula sp. PtaU1.Bin006]